MRRLVGLTLLLAFAGLASAEEAPSKPAVDAPELATLGEHRIGYRTVSVVEDRAVDLQSGSGVLPYDSRRLTVEVWYPATVATETVAATYAGSFTAEPPAPPTNFTRPGIAVRDATPKTGSFPLVIVSHGYDNDAIALSWLTENLTSKGYIVAAIRHADPPITDRTGFPEVLLRRPLDIAQVAAWLPRLLGDAPAVDPSRIALIGYSMGGYGVLTAAGGELDPDSPLVGLVPGGLLKHYARGGDRRDSTRVAGLKAVVALAPAGGSLGAWGADGLRGITTPLLLIAGDRDGTVDYKSGARAFFDQATSSNRYLLTFLGGGHRIGLGPAPEGMRRRQWDQDWFEDAVWRSERIVGINLHFITAFLDRYVKDDASRASYLDGLTPRSNDGTWPPSPGEVYGAFSPGSDGITVWKGFQRGHAEGLELLHESPH